MGLFVSLEGIDGAGKTTQIEMLRRLPSAKDWLFTRNPGGTALGAELRKILLHDETFQLKGISELFLYMADRSHHAQTELSESLSSKEGVVICDRYIDSTVAYQGYGRGLDVDMIMYLNELAVGDIVPQITFFLNISPETALKRLKNKDKIENLGLDFLYRVQNGFIRLSESFPERIVVIDCDGRSPKFIHEQIVSKLQPLLP